MRPVTVPAAHADVACLCAQAQRSTHGEGNPSRARASASWAGSSLSSPASVSGSESCPFCSHKSDVATNNSARHTLFSSRVCEEKKIFFRVSRCLEHVRHGRMVASLGFPLGVVSHLLANEHAVTAESLPGMNECAPGSNSDSQSLPSSG